MKIRLLSTVICAAVVSTMVNGLLQRSQRACHDSRSSGRSRDSGKKTQQQGIRRQPRQMGLWTTAMSRLRLWQKGFQHDFWKAVKMGSEQAAEDLGLKSTNL